MPHPSSHPAHDPLGVQSARWPTRLAWIAGGVAVLVLSSRAAIPMVPVPITLQTLAVTLIGALYGWRLGALTVAAWLIAAALGLPLLSDGAGGPGPFTGPTAGYLFAFPPAAVLTGALAARGWNGERPGRAFLAMLAGNALCLVFGTAWLAGALGAAAIEAGLLPFLPGALVKSAAGAAILAGLVHIRRGGAAGERPHTSP